MDTFMDAGKKITVLLCKINYEKYIALHHAERSSSECRLIFSVSIVGTVESEK